MLCYMCQHFNLNIQEIKKIFFDKVAFIDYDTSSYGFTVKLLITLD